MSYQRDGSPSPMPETHQMALKILYSFDDHTSFLARSKKPQPVRTIEVDDMDLGVISILLILSCVMEASPELFADPARDYAIYATDVFEPDQPLVGHGRVSRILQNGGKSDDEDDEPQMIMIPGKVCSNLNALLTGRKTKTLEVRLRFNKVDVSRAQKSHSVSQIQIKPREATPPMGQFQTNPSRNPSNIANILANRPNPALNPITKATRTQSMPSVGIFNTAIKSRAPGWYPNVLDKIAELDHKKKTAEELETRRIQLQELSTRNRRRKKRRTFYSDDYISEASEESEDETVPLVQTKPPRNPVVMSEYFDAERYDRLFAQNEGITCFNCHLSDTIIWYDFSSQAERVREYYFAMRRRNLPGESDNFMCSLCQEYAKAKGQMRSRTTVREYHRKKLYKSSAKNHSPEVRAINAPSSPPPVVSTPMEGRKSSMLPPSRTPTTLNSKVASKLMTKPAFSSPYTTTPTDSFIHDFTFLEGQTADPTNPMTDIDPLPQLAAKCNTTVINLSDFDEANKENHTPLHHPPAVEDVQLDQMLQMGSDDAMVEFENLIRRSLKSKSSPVSLSGSPYKFDGAMAVEDEDPSWMDQLFSEPLSKGLEATPVEQTPVDIPKRDKETPMTKANESFRTMPSSPLRIYEDDNASGVLPFALSPANHDTHHTIEDDSEATEQNEGSPPSRKGDISYDSRSSALLHTMGNPFASTPPSELSGGESKVPGNVENEGEVEI
ncbi:hypothetical protein BABINDRAFT_8958 [Babjeviella inositovora NRRL Y-12698]|uniref:Ams2/SPT21 N-terminal domain-containing protein n=1 Tax=Babjeviella inositovora NRRL Y-12698 TaxID=984486 RepID=A0A1E3QMM2_9ASCO|nr:uncharacterized protein BABINDRAFT_8958 [Babjeviella inositovora NRRL Y-12698]ODQ78714.1 hypothetical protein BABINDRAFT_8958 [Babjeviella inositovora NRRL Y-12698]